MTPPLKRQPLITEGSVEPLSLEFIRSVESSTSVTASVIRYLALSSWETDSAPASAIDWEDVVRDWAVDDDLLRGGPFAHALHESERQAAELQGRDVRRLVRRVGTQPHPDARTEADVTVGPDTPVPVADGATDAVSPIYLSKADTGPLEEEWVIKAMRSGYVAPLGPMVDEFERRMAERVGVSHALALSSGTAALHLLLLGVGARTGTYVIVPTMTFAATVNAVMYTGATPFFVDVQESDANIDVDLTLQAIDQLQAEGKEVAAVLAVDLYGRCADYTRLEPALVLRGVTLLEDAAEALGATHAGRAAGAFGRGAVLSFNGNKIMTTSGGGMLLSNDGDLMERARYLSTQARQPVPWYEHTEVGYNYRLSNILAGIGIAQLSRLDEMIARRREIRHLYKEGLRGLPGVRFLGDTPNPPGTDDNYWLTSLVVQSKHVDVNAIIAAMAAQRIECRHLWKPLHDQSAYPTLSHLSGAAARLFSRGLNVPSGASLQNHQIATTYSLVTNLISESAYQRSIS